MGLLREGVELTTHLGNCKAQLGELLWIWLGIAETFSQTPGSPRHLVEVAQHLHASR
jgi:hypothetical protein